MASPTPRAVKRALHALAMERRQGSDATADADPDVAVEDVADARETIAVGNETLGSVESAATFAADDGVERVRDAVGVATRADDAELRRAGESVLESIAAYRRAADTETPRVGTHLGCDGQRANR